MVSIKNEKSLSVLSLFKQIYGVSHFKNLRKSYIYLLTHSKPICCYRKKIALYRKSRTISKGNSNMYGRFFCTGYTGR